MNSYADKRILLLNELEKQFPGAKWDVKSHYYMQDAYPIMDEFWINVEVRGFFFYIKVARKWDIPFTLEMIEDLLKRSFIQAIRTEP